MKRSEHQRFAEFSDRIRPLLDHNGMLEDAAARAAHDRDATGIAGASPLAILRPRNADELSKILSVASEMAQPVVVQGGRTGLAGGARPRDNEVAIVLERMRTRLPVDEADATIEVEAGVPLEEVQKAALEADLYFGVDLGARGTATVGGMISTNAGGIRVLRYGMFRDQIAGLEGVLADGTILTSMRGLVKDNAGYDLRQLFIGTEGTLGIVTRAKLRLHPAPITQGAALLSLGSIESAMRLLALLRQRLGDLLAAFEIMLPEVYEGTLKHMRMHPPLRPGSQVYILTDIQGRAPDTDIKRFHAALGEALEDGIAEDAVVSSSGREFNDLWAIREGINAYIFAQGKALGFDVGIPLSSMANFLADARQRVHAIDGAASPFVFGHLGDGNLHYIVRTEHPTAVANAVLAATASSGGTISAEHGIGRDKRDWLHLCRSDAEISVMARLKQTLDPAGILNCERVIPGRQ